MTEKEAREKWCPFWGIVLHLHVNDDALKPIGEDCIGSDCALWQWNGYPDSQGERKGYCGLGRK